MVSVCAVFRLSRNAARRLADLDFYVYKEGAPRRAWQEQHCSFPDRPPNQQPAMHTPTPMSFVTPWDVGTGPGAGNDRVGKCRNQFGDSRFQSFRSWSSPFPKAARPGMSAARNSRSHESHSSHSSLSSRAPPNDYRFRPAAYQLRVLAAVTPAAAHGARHRCIKGVDHCVVSCNDSFRKTRREIGQYLVDTTSFHLVHHISCEVVRCPLD
jgi:hypothetical protein